MSAPRNPFVVWFSELVEWLWPEDPSVPPAPAALDRFPAAQAAYLEYLNTPLVWASIDRMEIEKQLSIFLEALNEADRPVRWFDSFAPADAYVRDKCSEDIVRRAGAVIGDDGALEAGALGTPESGGNGDPDWLTAHEAAWQAAVADLPARVRARWEHVKYACEEAREMAQGAACSAAARSRGQPDWSPVRREALRLSTEIADEACETAWIPARWSVTFEHGAALGKRGRAQGAAGRCAHAALRRAFAAGLWIFWVREENVIAVPAPNLYTDDQGRLHRTGGPAVEWPGETHWFLDGEPAATGEISEDAQEVVAAPASDLYTNSREDFSRRRESAAERPDEPYWFEDRTSISDIAFSALINGLLVLFFACRGLVRFLLKALIGPFVKRSR